MQAVARTDGDGNPVPIGLVALLGVGLVVGLLLSGAALAVTQVLGLDDGGSGGGGTATAQQSMVLPTPSPTPEDDGPAITLAPAPAPGAAAGDGGVTTTAPPPTPSTAPATGITLTSSVTQVGPGERIPLSGTYPGGEGAVLQVERFTGGTWTEFPVDARVTGGSFSTYVQTSQTGETKFRVRDTGGATTSNEVTVTVG